MSKNRAIFYFSTLCCLTLVSLDAIESTWINPGGGTYFTNANWNNGIPPLLSGDIANFPNTLVIDNSNIVAATSAVVLGALNYSPGAAVTNTNLNFTTLGLNNPGSSASINVLSKRLSLNSAGPPNAILLINPTIFNLSANAELAINLQIEGLPPLTINGPSNSTVFLNNTNTYTGLTTVNGARLTLNGVNSLRDSVVVNGGTLFIGNSAAFNPASNVTMNGGLFSVNGLNLTFNSLAVFNNGLVNTGGGILNLNSASSPLTMGGGTIQLLEISLTSGGPIVYNPALSSGVALIENGPSNPFITIDLNGFNVNLNIGESPSQPFEMAFNNADITDGSLTKIGPGTVLFEGVTTIPALTINEGEVLMGLSSGDTINPTGTLTINPGAFLGGFGTFGALGDANVINAGFVEPGTLTGIGTLTFSGSYTQLPSGTLLIQGVSPTFSDKLVVNIGSVNLAGNLIINAPNGNFIPGETFVILDNTGGLGITGRLNHIIENLPDNVLANLIYRPNQVLINFFVSPEAELEIVEDAAFTMVTEHSLNITRRLREVRRRYTDQPPKEDYYTAHAPYDKKTIALKGRRTQESKYIVVEPEIDASRFWKKSQEQPASVYIAPLGSFGSVDQICRQPGYDFHSFGGLIGADYAFNRAGIGAHLGYEKLKAHPDHIGGSVEVQSGFGELYGTFLPINNRNFFLDLIAGGSRNWYHFERESCGITATGHTHGWEYDGYAGIGYDIDYKSLRFTPLVSLQYIHYQINSFCETGAGPNNLFIHDQTTHSLRSWIGGSIGGKFVKPTATYIPEVRGFWIHEYANPNSFAKVSLTNVDSTSKIELFGPGRNYGVIGAELRVNFVGHWTLAGDYDYMWSSASHVNYLYGELGYNF